MEIKGTAVKSIQDFVKVKYASRYNEWLKALPDESRKIMEGGIYANQWYPMNEAGVVPTSKIGELFYQSLRDGAWESGKFSAEQALTGIYKFYVKVSSPGHIIERAGRVFQAYYQPSEMIVNNKTNTTVNVQITKFLQPNDLIEYRIGGWMERALEISGCKNVKVSILQSLARGGKITDFAITWQ